MKIGFIGTGNMSKALISGASGCEFELFATNRTEQKGRDVCQQFSVNYIQNNQQLCKACDVIILGVKPNMYEQVIAEIRDFCSGKILVSIAPGLTLTYLKSLVLQDTSVVRSMPNTPAQVLCGMTGISFDESISDEKKAKIISFFESVGKVLEIPEQNMDILCAISGCSPAFSYMFIDALAKTGQKYGLDYNSSLILASNTVFGASKMVLENDISPDELKNNVCSKGGVTVEGVKVLEQWIYQTLQDTIDATIKKSIELTK